MQVLVLGSAAGGGFPQWNCNCANCESVRQNREGYTARTQSSIAISSDGKRWLLCNASPDIRSQLNATPELWPTTLRGSGIAEVLLVDAQVDHVTGLLSLREGCPLDVWCTPNAHSDLTSGFPLFNMLSHWNGGLQWRAIGLDETTSTIDFDVPSCEGLHFTAFALASNAPPYSPRRGRPSNGDNLGLFITDKATGKSLCYAPGLGQPTEEAMGYLKKADVVMVDGTVWEDDELIRTGVGTSTGQQMGHLALNGQGGMREYLATLPDATRKILIHINNTNPILDEASEERALLTQEHIEVAFDGMRLTL